MDLDQICVKMILVKRCFNIKKNMPIKMALLTKLAKWKNGKIFQCNCTSFVLQGVVGWCDGAG